MSFTNGSYWGPDESEDAIAFEKTFLSSGYMTGFGYGMQFILYLQCMKILWDRRPHTNFTYFLLAFISILCALNTIFTALSVFDLQLTFIDYRNYPGGVFASIVAQNILPVNIAAFSCYVASNYLADGLLLWRCRVIYTASLQNKVDWLMLGPFVVYLGSIATGISFMWFSTRPSGTNFFADLSVNTATAYFSLSLGLNIILTLMIVTRLYIYQRNARKILGETGDRRYTTISAIFIESAALYGICSVLLLGTYISGNVVNQIFLGLSPAVQVMASYLIIIRVAQGKAWSTKTPHTVLSTMAFVDRSGPTRGAGGTTGSTGASRTILNTSGGGIVDVPLNDLGTKSKDNSTRNGHMTYDGDSKSQTESIAFRYGKEV